MRWERDVNGWRLQGLDRFSGGELPDVRQRSLLRSICPSPFAVIAGAMSPPIRLITATAADRRDVNFAVVPESNGLSYFREVTVERAAALRDCRLQSFLSGRGGVSREIKPLPCPPDNGTPNRG